MQFEIEVFPSIASDSIDKNLIYGIRWFLIFIAHIFNNSP